MRARIPRLIKRAVTEAVSPVRMFLSRGLWIRDAHSSDNRLLHVIGPLLRGSFTPVGNSEEGLAAGCSWFRDFNRQPPANIACDEGCLVSLSLIAPRVNAHQGEIAWLPLRAASAYKQILRLRAAVCVDHAV